MNLLAGIFGAGFFASSAVHTALIVGLIVAVVSAVTGTFTVMRGQSFAGHSLADIGTAGGSAAFLVGAQSPLFGFLAFNVIAAAVMDLIGIRRPRGRDLATGIVLGVSLGLAALFLYEVTATTSISGATMNVVFGDLFSLPPSQVPFVAVLSVVAVALIAFLYRPLLLTSVNAELAVARGIPVRLVSIGYLLALAVTVSLSAITIGAILSTALLIGPAASAMPLTRRTDHAIALAAAIAVAAVFIGVLLAWDSFYWSTSNNQWPVSFTIVAVLFVFYALAQLLAHWRGRSARRTQAR